MPNKGKIAPKEKVNIVERYLSGKIGRNEASRQMGVDESTISEWASRYIAEDI